MKQKWSFIAAILVAGITGGFAFMGQSLIAKNSLELEVIKQKSIEEATRNTLELERLKMQAENTERKRKYFEKRCNSIEALYGQMNLKYQKIYEDSTPENIHPAFVNLTDLNAHVQMSVTYLGDRALKVLEEKWQAQKKEDAEDPVKRIEPYILALREEVKDCNGPDSFINE